MSDLGLIQITPPICTHIFSNSIGMINAIDALGHKHRLLLVRHGVPVLACHVAQTRHHAEALRDLAVHRSVHIVQQIQSLRDELMALGHCSRLNLVLTSRVEVISVRCL